MGNRKRIPSNLREANECPARTLVTHAQVSDNLRAMDAPTIAGESAADRLMRSLDYRLHPTARRLTREEVAVVMHALADHTAIEAALRFRPEPESPWPYALSVGRWFHAVGDQLDRS